MLGGGGRWDPRNGLQLECRVRVDRRILKKRRTSTRRVNLLPDQLNGTRAAANRPETGNGNEVLQPGTANRKAAGTSMAATGHFR
jgi:hypothetical protein